MLGVNGLGNFAGVIGSQLYQSKYAPGYRLLFYAPLGFVAAALAGYVPCQFTIAAVDKRKERKLQKMTVEEIEFERTDNTYFAQRDYLYLLLVGDYKSDLPCQVDSKTQRIVERLKL